MRKVILTIAVLMISVGLGAELQSRAIGTTATPGSTRYLGLALDTFVEYPFDADNAVAFYLQAGYRFDQLERVASVEYFNGDLPGSGVTTYRVGPNYWLSKHTYNVKAELAIPRLEQVTGGPAVQNNVTGTLQAQLVF